jgi:hypothetical protein
LISARNSRTPGRVYTDFGPMYAGTVAENSARFPDPLDDAGEWAVSQRMPFMSRTIFSHFRGRLFWTTNKLLGRRTWYETSTRNSQWKEPDEIT